MPKMVIANLFPAISSLPRPPYFSLPLSALSLCLSYFHMMAVVCGVLFVVRKREAALSN